MSRWYDALSEEDRAEYDNLDALDLLALMLALLAIAAVAGTIIGWLT